MHYILIRPPRGAALSGTAAKTLVGYALRRSGRSPWPVMCIEHFSSDTAGDSFLIARPSCGVEAQLADYAYPFLRYYQP